MPWPWTRRGPAEDDLRALRNQVADLESAIKRLRSEWEDMYEKLVRRSERLRKREERQEQQIEMPEANGMPLDRKAALRARARLS